MTDEQDGDDQELTGPQAVILQFEAAPKAPPPTAPAPAPAPGRDGGAVTLPAKLPEDCPVTPLGKSPAVCYYLDAEHFPRAMKASEHSRLGLIELFGREQDWMTRNYPKWIKGEIKYDAEALGRHLIQACAVCGAWSPKDKLRGRGGWLGRDGELVLHFGDRVYMIPAGSEAPATFKTVKPGAIDGKIYPSDIASPPPAAERVAGGADAPGQQVLDLLSAWNWSRTRTDPIFLLGWIGCAFLGGAIPWRPMAWISGDRATGKSTLHELLRELIGAAGVVSVTDTTSAGIYQALGHSCLPVAIDELEAEDDNRRAQAVIKLARAASSGGVTLRGTVDGRAIDFEARSCFLFSSILIPPLLSQDRSRMAFLDLGRLKATGITLDRKWLAQRGAELRRRLMDGWHRWPATLETYRHALTDAGHGGRGADQFGSLLAAADLILHDTPPGSDELAEWGAALNAVAMGDQDDTASDHARWLQHLLTSMLDSLSPGKRRTVAVWMAIAAKREPGDDVLANETLQAAGLRVMKGKDGREWLAIANSHVGLQRLHKESRWAGMAGTAGVWRQAALRVEGAVKSSGPVWFHGGHSLRCSMIPLDRAIGKAPAALPGGADEAEGL